MTVTNPSRTLLEGAPRMWDSMLTLPVLRAVGEGRVEDGRFDFWVQQEFHQVVGARRFLSLLMARTEEQDTVQRLGRGILALADELERLQDCARERKIVLAVERAPVCEASVNFFINSAVNSFEAGMAALYGRERTLLEVGRALRETAHTANPYLPWIDRWSSPEAAAYTSWVEATLNRYLAGSSETVVAPLARVCRLAVRYQYLFWKMVEEQEQWPI